MDSRLIEHYDIGTLANLIGLELLDTASGFSHCWRRVTSRIISDLYRGKLYKGSATQ